MSVLNGPNMVKDGLVLNLDAGNEKSYPLNSTLSVKNGCVLWLDATDSNTIQFGSGNSIYKWKDKSGNQNDVSQITASYQPTLIPNSLNGKPTVRFDGSNDILTGTIPNGVDNCTLIIVMKYISTTSEDIFFGIGEAGTVSKNRWMYNVAGNTFSFASWGNDCGAGQDLSVGGGYHIYTIRQNGTSINFYKDGVFTSGTVGTLLTTNNKISIGGMVGNDGHYNTNMESSEAIIYNRVLTDEEIKITHTYLGRKYGIINIDYPTIWKDISGHSSHLTIYGSPTVTNVGNVHGFNFTTTGQFMEGEVSNLPSQSLTLEVWFYPTTEIISPSEMGTLILGKGGGGQSFYLSWDKGTQKMANYWYGKNNEGYHESTAPSSRDRWHHWCSVWDNSNLYQWSDGVKTTVSNIFGNCRGVTSVTIGQESTSRQFSGHISIVRIYNRALTTNEVLQNYNSHKSRFGI